jgi:hypothetical protein
MLRPVSLIWIPLHIAVEHSQAHLITAISNLLYTPNFPLRADVKEHCN